MIPPLSPARGRTAAMAAVAARHGLALVLVALLSGLAACSTGSDHATASSASAGSPSGDPAGDGPTSTQPPATEPVSTITTTTTTTNVAAGAGDPSGGFVPPPAQWQLCGMLECATVAVPLDYAVPQGPRISIAMIRRKATGDRRGSIFVDPGGPGASGVAFVRGRFRLDTQTMAAYDLIGFDPRGVGTSTAVTCSLDRSKGPQPDYSPDTPAEVEALADQARHFAAACGATDQALLAHLSTEAVADDLDVLRQAVGDPQLHYLGFSFGTLIGLLYAQQFPQRVGHIVLDGVVDPTADLPTLLREQAIGFEKVFAVLDQACGTGLTCPPGGAAAARDRLMAQLERSGPVGRIGPAELDNATLITLYGRSIWPVYARALTAALAGDMSGIGSLSDQFTTAVPFGAYAGVECTDGPRPADPAAWNRFVADLVAAAPRFGAAVANELRTCAYWSVPAGSPRPAVTAAGAAPIVVVGNTNDPATPLANAEAVAASLERASLVVAELDGHTAYSDSACVRQLVGRYFLDDALPPTGTRC